MIEARIVCTCTRISLPDVETDLSQGQTVFLSETAAKNSTDLARAIRVGAVSLVYVQRCSERRDEEGPAFVSTARPMPVRAPTVPAQSVFVDAEDIAARVVRRMGTGSTDGMRTEVGRQLDAMRSVLRAELRADMVDVLRAAGADIPNGSRPSGHERVSTTSVPDDEPVFIPTTIGEDLVGDVGVDEAVSVTGVADAAAALRAARSRKKKKEA